MDPGNDLNNANDYAGRMQLLFEPNEDFSLLLNARYSLQEIRTGFFENVSGSLDTAGNGVKEDNCALYTNFNGYCDDDGDNFAGDYDKLGHNDLETYGFTGTLKWQLGDNLLTVIMTARVWNATISKIPMPAPMPISTFSQYRRRAVVHRDSPGRRDGPLALGGRLLLPGYRHSRRQRRGDTGSGYRPRGHGRQPGGGRYF